MKRAELIKVPLTGYDEAMLLTGPNQQCISGRVAYLVWVAIVWNIPTRVLISINNARVPFEGTIARSLARYSSIWKP